ncbi:MAG TPA: glycosyltransferase family 1 protein [Bryobacteraceae bacterium]|nr:glycosyltransferase family 1 protein [Bryobacteraceae bacterium]
MRITIDATSALLRSAGVKGYTYHLLRHLRRQARADDVISAFPMVGEWDVLDHEHSAWPPMATLGRLALLHSVNIFGHRILDRALNGARVFHASNLVRCAPGRARLTATVHDLTSWIMPEVHTEATARADRSFAQRILKRADALIAVSENTRQDAIRVLGLEPERIRTIYSGVPSEYFDAIPRPRDKPYVLYVGTVEPRKNLGTLLDAWGSLPPDLREHFDLIVAGPEGWHSTATMARIRTEAVYLGYVPESEMPGLMAGAAVFVYPSLYEGFGFPVVQAMAANVPVVCSNTSCLPEVAGGAAALVDPRSVSEIAAQLGRLLESPGERTRLAQLGRIQAERFKWERCAEESLAFFREVAGR